MASAAHADVTDDTTVAKEGAAPGAAAKAVTSIQEIVVTAQKREENVQRVPEAVSVLSGAVQRLRGQSGLDDLQTTVPNVQYTFTSNTSQLFIRGVGDVFINAGGDPGVAFYQDDAYVSDQTTSNTGLYDIDRIEVLRGPQGALYGRNAVGGAIDVISAKPTDAFHAFVEAQLGDYGRRDSEGYVSGPTGVAATDVRFSYQIRNLDGYTRNLLAGQLSPSGPAPDRFDDLHSQAFRIQTLTRLPADGTLSLLYSYYHEKENGPALAVKPYAGFVYPAQVLFGDAPTSEPRAVEAQFGSLTANVSAVNLHYVQPVGRYSLTVVGNYRASGQTMLNDCDSTPAQACTYYRPTRSEEYYIDTHLASPDDDRLRWLVGATYVHFRDSEFNYVPLQSLAIYLVPGSAPNAAFPITVTGGGTLWAESYAVYADLRFRINNTWAINGQVRYNQTTKNAVQFLTVPEFGVAIQDYTGPGSHLSYASIPFKVGLEGQLTPDVLVYANYAEAHKDGAINLGAVQTSPVKPEDVSSAEIGAKILLFDRRLQVNAAVFDSQYDNLQISQIHLAADILSNVPKSSIKGAELEILARPAAGLQLGLNAGYLDAKFKDFSNSPVIPGNLGGPEQNLSGKTLPYDPRFTLNADLAYSFRIADGYQAWVDVQYSWHDRIYFNEFNTLDNSQSAVGVVNLAGSISHGPWKVYAFIHNLTDETIISGTTIYSGTLGAERATEYAPPREFAIGLAYQF